MAARRARSLWLVISTSICSLHISISRSETASRRPAFFRLVRSRTLCEAGVDEIATRRPNDDPGPGDFHYCLNRLDGTIVDKTHIPYDLSPQKLERIRQTFLEPQWDVKTLPGYSEETAGNPFVTFADIPVRVALPVPARRRRI